MRVNFILTLSINTAYTRCRNTPVSNVVLLPSKLEKEGSRAVRANVSFLLTVPSAVTTTPPAEFWLASESLTEF